MADDSKWKPPGDEEEEEEELDETVSRMSSMRTLNGLGSCSLDL